MIFHHLYHELTQVPERGVKSYIRRCVWCAEWANYSTAQRLTPRARALFVATLAQRGRARFNKVLCMQQGSQETRFVKSDQPAGVFLDELSSRNEGAKLSFVALRPVASNCKSSQYVDSTPLSRVNLKPRGTRVIAQ
jgi:hypothetical protein